MRRIAFPFFLFSCLVVMIFALNGCITTGTSSTAVSGAAAGEYSEGEGEIIRCPETLGTLAIDDSRWQSATTYSIEPLLRLAVQQSNCFAITSIGNAHLDRQMQRITNQQRHSGEYRAGSRQQKGQRVAADYFLDPFLVINNAPATGIDIVSRALSWVPGVSYARGVVGGDMDSKVSVVTLSLFDIRSATQIAISEGSSTATNFGAAMRAFGVDSARPGFGSAGAALSGYKKTPEGMATIAAFLDAYNKMVVALGNYKAQNVKGGMGTGGRLKVN